MISHLGDAILITGSSGFVGKHLLKKLSSLGNPVVAMYKKHLPEPQPNIYPVCSDMESSELMIAPLRGVHTVVHLAWSNNIKGYKYDEEYNFEDITFTSNLKILYNLIKAMEKIKTPRIIFLSFLGVNKKAAHPFLREKYLAEFLILNSNISQKIILRLPLIYSLNPNDNFLNSILNVIKIPLICPIPCNKNKEIKLIFLDDLIEILIKIINTEIVHQHFVIDISGINAYKLKDIISLVSYFYYKKRNLILNGQLGSCLFKVLSNFSKHKNTSSLSIKDYCEFDFEVDSNTLVQNEMYYKYIKDFSYTKLSDQLLRT